jgi:CheY-like chemotaxis protein
VPGRFPPTVLYLEPAEAVRRLMCDFLRKRGYKVLEAESGAEALQLVEEQAAPIHVAVLNSILPAMSCSEIVDHMLAMRPQVKVLYLAGSHDPDLMGGGKEVLQKPFTPDDLSRRIGELLQAHPAAAPV